MSSNQTYTFDEKMKREQPEEWKKMILERTAHVPRTPVGYKGEIRPRSTYVTEQGWKYKT